MISIEKLFLIHQRKVSIVLLDVLISHSEKDGFISIEKLTYLRDALEKKNITDAKILLTSSKGGCN